jgi:uncharacterized repeat protein (TIGR01451 family)
VFYATPDTPGINGGADAYYGLYRSNDAGQTWKAANGGNTFGYIAAVAVDPANPQIVYVVGPALLKSTDGGNSWTTLPLDAATTAALAVDPNNGHILYAWSAGTGLQLSAAPGQISRSGDGGSAWQVLGVLPQMPMGYPGNLTLDPNRTSSVIISTDHSGGWQFTVAPDLAVQVVAPTANPLPVGASAQYQFAVSNRGPYDATGVTLTVTLPSSATSISMPGQSNCSDSGTTVTCTLDIVRSGASAHVSITVTPSAAGDFPVSASVKSEQPDPDMTNNAAAASNTAAVVPAGSGGGTGGGGTISVLWLLALGALLLSRVVELRFRPAR